MDNNQFTVLLVEDDINDIFIVKRAFRSARIPNPLQVVTDGEEAISYLQGDGKYADRNVYPLPRLMVMDINMPRRSGFEVLEWVKTKSQPLRRMPIIIVSSSDSPADINRAYELGANAYMIKPMNYRAVEHLFESITHYWGLECAKPELEAAWGNAEKNNGWTRGVWLGRIWSWEDSEQTSGAQLGWARNTRMLAVRFTFMAKLAAYPKPDQYVLDCFALDMHSDHQQMPVFDYGRLWQ